MDWLDVLNHFFDLEEIPKHKKVKIAKSKLKGSTLNWQNFTQSERMKLDKNPIGTWKRMEALVKEDYVLEAYEVQLHTKRQNLRQREMDVSSQTEEFHKIAMKSNMVEPKSVKIAR